MTRRKIAGVARKAGISISPTNEKTARKFHKRKARCDKFMKPDTDGRHKLTPKRRKNKLPIIPNWPDLHDDMQLSEFTAARGQMMEVLNDAIQPQGKLYKYVELFRKSDDACIKLWDTIATLRSFDVSGSTEQDIGYLLHFSLTTDMETALEILTCKLLDPENCRKLNFGLWDEGSFSSVAERFRKDMVYVSLLNSVGDMIIGAYEEKNFQLMVGALRTFELVYEYREIKEEKVTFKARYRMSKAEFMGGMEKRKGRSIVMNGVRQETEEIASGTRKRNRRLSFAGISTIPLAIAAKDATYRETLTQELSDCSSSDEGPHEIYEIKPLKRARYSQDTTRFFESKSAVSIEGALNMGGVMAEIESIMTAEDTTGIQALKMEGLAIQDHMLINPEQDATQNEVSVVTGRKAEDRFHLLVGPRESGGSERLREERDEIRVGVKSGMEKSMGIDEIPP